MTNAKSDTPRSPEIDKEALRREVDAALGHNARAQDQGPQHFVPAAGTYIKHVIGVVSGKGGAGVGSGFVVLFLLGGEVLDAQGDGVEVAGEGGVGSVGV